MKASVDVVSVELGRAVMQFVLTDGHVVFIDGPAYITPNITLKVDIENDDEAQALLDDCRNVVLSIVSDDPPPLGTRSDIHRLVLDAGRGTLDSCVARLKDGQLVCIVGADISHHKNVWFRSVKHADEGEAKELCERLLAPEVEMDDYGRTILNDFAWRYFDDKLNRHWNMNDRRRLARMIARGLKRRRTRPATPIYARSEVDAKIDCAVADVRASRKAGLPTDVKEIAEKHFLSPSTLENALNGSRGSSQRKAKRLKKAMPRHEGRGKG
jgi:hypothetical protein